MTLRHKLMYGPAFRAALVDRCDFPIDPSLGPLKGLSLLFISDIHASSRMFPPACVDALIAQAAALKADVICYGGDFAESWRDFCGLMPRLQALKAPLGAYAVLGNNDYDAARGDVGPLTALMAKHGITPLVDAEASVPVGGAQLRLAGLNSHSAHTVPGKPFFEGDGAGELRVVLAHYPWHLLETGPLCVHAPHMGLSGHTHGGQVKLFGLSPYSVGYELRQYKKTLGLSGWTTAPGYPALVSPGVGMSKIPLRLNAPPAIHLITLA